MLSPDTVLGPDLINILIHEVEEKIFNRMYIKSGSDRKLEEMTKVPVSELRFTQIDRGGLEFWTEAKKRCSLDRTNAHKSRSRGSAAHYMKETEA